MRASLAAARERHAANEVEATLAVLLETGAAADDAESDSWHSEWSELVEKLGILSAVPASAP